MSWPEGIKADELALPPADGAIGQPSWSHSGELLLMVKIGECWQADQLSYHPGPDPELWVGPPQSLYYLQMVGICEKISPAVPKQQDLHDARQQQDNWEESQWRSNIDNVAKARDLKPDQWLIAMNICKWRCVDRGIYCGTHCDTLQLPRWDVFYAFCCLCVFFGGGLQGQRKDMKGQGKSRAGVSDVQCRWNWYEV